MITIENKHKLEIGNLKKKVELRSKQETEWFEAICKKVGVDPDSCDGTILFDHIFNDCQVAANQIEFK
jgi:hypothetical protein